MDKNILFVALRDLSKHPNCDGSFKDINLFKLGFYEKEYITIDNFFDADMPLKPLAQEYLRLIITDD